MTLILNALINRPLIKPAGTTRRYLMLSISAPEGTTRPLPVNLALVIDRSGSMSGGRLEQAKAAARLLVEQLRADDRVSPVAYDDEVTLVAPSTVITSDAGEHLLRRIEPIVPGGSTALHAGWLAGCQQVAAAANGLEPRIDRAILLTDGYANVGETDPNKICHQARELRKRGVETSTMGIGAHFAHELLEPMSVAGGGRFHKLRKPEDIRLAVAGELEEMRRTYARQLVLEIALPPGVQVIRSLNRYEVERSHDGIHVYVGNILAGDTRNVVLEFSAPPGLVGELVTVRSRASYLTAYGERQQQPLPPVQYQYAPVSEVQNQKVVAAVDREVSLLLAASAREKSVLLSKQGKHEAAARVLESSALKMAQGPYASEPTFIEEVTLLRRLAEEARRGPDEHAIKERQYQAHLQQKGSKRYDTPGV